MKVQIAPLKVDIVNSNGKIKFNLSAVANAITWAIDNNVDIINYSAGGTNVITLNEKQPLTTLLDFCMCRR